MFRPVASHHPPTYSQRWHDSLGRLLFPFVIWICVSVSVRYGYFGDCHMVLGPSSSRLMVANSIFVENVEVRDDDQKGLLLYGFSEKPELSLESNWSTRSYMIVAPYSRKGFSLWLNKGSRIHIRWETQKSTLDQLQVVMLKGERNYETLQPILTNSAKTLNLSEPINGKEAEYTIEEDDKYYIGLMNTNPKNIIMSISVNVTSKMYDLSKARNMCSTIKGSCRLKLPFPNTQYFVVTTPDNGDLGGWYLELSFVARVITYIVMLGFIIVLIFVVLKYLGACDGDSSTPETETREISETSPILPEKSLHFSYGTNEENDDETSSASSSEDLYDAKLCAICYDDQRNCFFIPCGHCATCYDCAERIMDEDSKMCPICRRPIHKVRRLFSA